MAQTGGNGSSLQTAGKKQDTRFAKGRSGNPHGRKKGTPNKSTVAIKEAARELVEDPAGRKKMLEQYRKGRLHPAILREMLHYAYGKPKETVSIEGQTIPAFVLRIEDGGSDESAG